MNSLMKDVILKYGKYVALINLAQITLVSFFPSVQLASTMMSVFMLLSNVLIMVVIGLAHYEYNNLNGRYISFGDAFKIGLILSLIHIVLSGLAFVVLQLINSAEMDVGAGILLLGGVGYVVACMVGQVFWLLILMTFEGIYKIYHRAGKPGWAAFVPVYNLVVKLEIVKKPVWWIILLLIPFVNIIFAIWITNLLAKRFGKDEGYTLGLILLPFVFFPLLGFGRDPYLGGSDDLGYYPGEDAEEY